MTMMDDSVCLSCKDVGSATSCVDRPIHNIKLTLLLSICLATTLDSPCSLEPIDGAHTRRQQDVYKTTECRVEQGSSRS